MLIFAMCDKCRRPIDDDEPEENLIEVDIETYRHRVCPKSTFVPGRNVTRKAGS